MRSDFFAFHRLGGQRLRMIHRMGIGRSRYCSVRMRTCIAEVLTLTGADSCITMGGSK
jgi:hypothetical protein